MNERMAVSTDGAHTCKKKNTNAAKKINIYIYKQVKIHTNTTAAPNHLGKK